jgi:hypothetical protein
MQMGEFQAVFGFQLADGRPRFGKASGFGGLPTFQGGPLSRLVWGKAPSLRVVAISDALSNVVCILFMVYVY